MLVPTVLVLLGLRSIVSLLFAAPSKPTRVNNKIDLSNAKVANVVPIPEAMAKAEQNDGKVVFCRCWKSKTFPFCDGMLLRLFVCCLSPFTCHRASTLPLQDRT